jgi:CRISPR/Cas system-associated exonuclease Cas4 (RecB family)
MIDFDAMIDNYLKREERPKDVGRYYPSEVGLCMRKTWYSYKYPVSVRPELMKIFEVGNLMHDFVVKVLSSEKNPEIMLVSAEAPFRKEIDDFVVSGRIDDIILIKANGKNVIVEVKSTGNVDMIEEPISSNRMQLQFYMYVLGIHNGVLLYLDKRNLRSKVFIVEYSENEAMKIVDRFRALHKLLKYDATPDPEARKSQDTVWVCRNCEYRDRCYKETPSSAKWL